MFTQTVHISKNVHYITGSESMTITTISISTVIKIITNDLDHIRSNHTVAPCQNDRFSCYYLSDGSERHTVPP